MVRRRAGRVRGVGVVPSLVPGVPSTARRRALQTRSMCRWAPSLVPRVPSTARGAGAAIGVGVPLGYLRAATLDERAGQRKPDLYSQAA
jgi:hypothetical protein